MRAARNLWHTEVQGGAGPTRIPMSLLVRINLVLAVAFTLAALGVPDPPALEPAAAAVPSAPAALPPRGGER